MGSREAIRPDGTAKYRGLACVDWRRKLAYSHMLRGVASPGETLYYYRCRGPNEYQEMIKRIKYRWMYQNPDVKHHPEGRRQ